VGQTAPGYRLSPHQESFWAAARAHAQAGLNVCCALRFAGEVWAEAVRAALRTAIARHEILRTVYVRQSGLQLPLQVILDELSSIWRETELVLLLLGCTLRSKHPRSAAEIFKRSPPLELLPDLSSRA
jgi:Condensation domain